MSLGEKTPELVAGELSRIVESVFETMLSLEVSECGTPGCVSVDRVRAMVKMTSEWTGAVLVECGQEAARRFTGRFLSLSPPPECVDDLVRDVLGELANMIGGNLKCVLNGGMRLSMPQVEAGEGEPITAKVHQSLAFQTEEGRFQVSVVTAA
jgi:CheY-specific phosphatase CheX